MTKPADLFKVYETQKMDSTCLAAAMDRCSVQFFSEDRTVRREQIKHGFPWVLGIFAVGIAVVIAGMYFAANVK